VARFPSFVAYMPTIQAPPNATPTSNNDPASLLTVALFRLRWFILGCLVVGGLGGYFWARAQPEYFRAMINCVPPRVDPSQQMGGLGGIGSALKDVGLTKLGAKGASTYEFMALLFSRSIRDSMIKQFDLVREYEMEQEPYDDVLDYFEDNVEINLRAEGNYEISIASRDTSKCVAMCYAFVDNVNKLSSNLSQLEAIRTTSYLERRINSLDSTMDVLSATLSKYSSSTLMFAPEQQATAIANTFSEVQSEFLKQETIMELLKQGLGASDPQVKIQEQLVQRLKAQISDMQNKPGYFGDFALRDAAGKGLPYLRLVGEIEALGKVKSLLVPSLEQARLDVTNATQSLMIVDHPRKPERRFRPKRMLVGLGTGVGSAALFIAIVTALSAWRNFKALNRLA